MLGLAVLVTFAPASRDLTANAPAPDRESRGERVVSVASGLAALPVSPLEAVVLPTPKHAGKTPAESAEVIVRTRRNEPESVTPAIISWWDDERWTEVEKEQAAWRSEWLREARRNPERVPLELWPRIVEWAPRDRSLERSARAMLGSDRALRRYADRRARSRPSDRSNTEFGAEVRRWANDVLRQLGERSSDRQNRSSRRRPPGG